MGLSPEVIAGLDVWAGCGAKIVGFVSSFFRVPNFVKSVVKLLIFCGYRRHGEAWGDRQQSCIPGRACRGVEIGSFYHFLISLSPYLDYHVYYYRH